MEERSGNDVRYAGSNVRLMPISIGRALWTRESPRQYCQEPHSGDNRLNVDASETQAPKDGASNITGVYCIHLT